MKITLPPIEADATEILVETAKALRVNHESKFWCTYIPEWKRVMKVELHHCGQFLLREGWQKGYQDIERTWEEVDRVYETRWDCIPMPERVRQAA